MRRALRVIVLLVAAQACGHAPPPPPPPPPPAKPAPPPPPPKCEAISEGCVAKEGTQARVVDSGWSIAVPEGWTYAQEPSVTVASTSGGVLLLTRYEGAPKATRASRDFALTALLDRGEITLKKKKLHLPRKPKKKLQVGKLHLQLFQVDATRQGKAGALLLVNAPMKKGTGLAGAAFVFDDDKTNADGAILQALQSLHRPAGAADAGADGLTDDDISEGWSGP